MSICFGVWLRLITTVMAIIELQARRRVIELHRLNLSGRKIAKKLNISLGAVQKILKKEKDGFGIENKPRSGRPRCLTPRMSSRIAVTAKRDPVKTARDIMHDCNLDGVVSLDTVKRELRRHGLFGRIAVKKPLLTSIHKNKRRKWCAVRREWTSLKWKSVVFSDECKLELRPNKRIYVRRQKGARMQPNCISPTSKYSRSIMVWGAVRGDGYRLLIRCENNVDSCEYQRILSVAFPVICSSRTLFQHDGAPAHRSRSTSDFLRRKAVRLLPDWPPQSPDLNIIENMWDELKRRISFFKPITLDELWEVAQREWKAIPNESICKLYDSMPRRVSAVLKNKGGNTKYWIMFFVLKWPACFPLSVSRLTYKCSFLFITVCKPK